MMNKLLLAGLCFCCFEICSYAQIINIPDDYPTIQQGIDVAIDGDTVLVAEGTYFENINFKGKNITLASYFLLDADVTHIESTIINGSNPIHPDTASCVLFINGETSDAILQGFTLTGGTGTKWLDEHGAGLYTEGGGILITYSSPTIIFNKIMFNTATNTNGTVSAGGGAIRAGDSNPLIQNNLIAYNQARYGGGIVLNYSGATVRNNIIDHNSGGEDFGGGGIWSVGNFTEPKIFQNNTITNNHSATNGGGIRFWSSPAEVSNSIIWGNTATTAPQIQGNTGVFSYCNVEGGWPGDENIDEDPMFDESNFYLMTGSPCIDAGNPDVAQNDPEDPQNPGEALFPSMGNLRNDMGAYGGPFSTEMADYLTNIKEPALLNAKGIDFTVHPNPCSGSLTLQYTTAEQGYIICDLFSISGVRIKNLINDKSFSGSNEIQIDLSDIPVGIYFCVFRTSKGMATRKMIKQ